MTFCSPLSLVRLSLCAVVLAVVCLIKGCGGSSGPNTLSVTDPLTGCIDECRFVEVSGKIIRDGPARRTSINGQLLIRGQYATNVRHGLWEYYDSSGVLVTSEQWAMGALVSTTGQEQWSYAGFGFGHVTCELRDIPFPSADSDARHPRAFSYATVLLVYAPTDVGEPSAPNWRIESALNEVVVDELRRLTNCGKGTDERILKYSVCDAVRRRYRELCHMPLLLKVRCSLR